MPEDIRVITAGRHDVYEVVKSEDGQRLTIREAQNHDHKIELISSVIPTLIQVLREIQSE